MTTQAQFMSLITPLAVRFHEVLDTGRTRTYYAHLYRHTEDELEHAIERCSAACRHFPRIDEIEEKCK